ncbi:hypothetical protein PHLGIDRAFT_20535 [Phlebiopsis gigantea 11061_1 CR5-6]|uniref:Uncharacterized protein n=1 Tax=Phlebiopsis gigantea (strain 11061_1 CR5-6) TaxID=745531 RepID=A0A0C3RZW2_PHLG1|nr:hypothetical protein PHLGIDRAFT_20535 [Phlebiopsis gigantea 11061_1 CR5-6]
MEHYRAKRPRPAPIPVDGEGVLGLPEAHRSALSSLSGIKTDTDVSLPPAPLFRPTTFWRNTKRSGVTGASYSPGCYLVRRSTFVAAGLTLDNPTTDLSAFAVESRVGVVFLPPDTNSEPPRT